MSDLLILILIVGCSTAFLSRLLAAERGPVGLLERFRNRFSEGSEVGKAVRCPICLGVYVSTVLTLYAVACLLWWPVGLYLLAIPAAGGIAYALIGLGNLWNS